jgi:hypothetical protein
MFYLKAAWNFFLRLILAERQALDITSYGGKTDDLKNDKILSCQNTTHYENKNL